MEIRVRLPSMLQKRTDPPRKEGEFAMEVQDGAEVGDVHEALGLPSTIAVVFLVNRHRSSPERSLKEGDLVAILPRITGG